MYVGMYVVAFEITRQRALNKKCKSTNTLSTKCGNCKTLCKTRHEKCEKKNVLLKIEKRIQINKVKMSKK